MKSILIITIAIFISINCLSQTNVDRVGLLVLGSKEKEIISQLESAYGKTQIAHKPGDLEKPKDKHTYILRFENKDDFMPYGAFKCPYAHYYMLRELKIGDVILNDMVIGFYDSSLYYIHSTENMSLLKRGVTARFGEAKITSTTTTTKCIDTATSLPKIEQTFVYTFRDDADIRCTDLISEIYSEKCEKNIGSLFTLENKKMSNAVFECYEENK